LGSGPRSGDPAGSGRPGLRRSPGPEVRDLERGPPGAQGPGRPQIPDPGIPGIPETRIGVPDAAPIGVLHQPLAAAPRGSREGYPGPRSRAGAPRGPERPPLPREGVPDPGPRDSRTTPPPRGVDVKETPAGSEIPKKGVPGPQILKTAKKSIFD